MRYKYICIKCHSKSYKTLYIGRRRQRDIRQCLACGHSTFEEFGKMKSLKVQHVKGGPVKRYFLTKEEIKARFG